MSDPTWPPADDRSGRGPGRTDPYPGDPDDTDPGPWDRGGHDRGGDPGPDAHPERPPAPPVAGRARRFWSARRVPAGITALLSLAALGFVLYDVAAVRAGRPAMAWRKRLAAELADRPLDNAWMVAGAVVAVVLGLWLIALALTPGLRQVLALRPGPGEVRAGLDRNAAALVLRDRALEVPGVLSARVGVSRRRARVRVESHFRELDDVREELAVVLGDALRGLALWRAPRLSLSVRRAGKE